MNIVILCFEFVIQLLGVVWFVVFRWQSPLDWAMVVCTATPWLANCEGFAVMALMRVSHTSTPAIEVSASPSPATTASVPRCPAAALRSDPRFPDCVRSGRLWLERCPESTTSTLDPMEARAIWKELKAQGSPLLPLSVPTPSHKTVSHLAVSPAPKLAFASQPAPASQPAAHVPAPAKSPQFVSAPQPATAPAKHPHPESVTTKSPQPASDSAPWSTLCSAGGTYSAISNLQEGNGRHG